MKKGFRILYDTIQKKWEVKYFGCNQYISYFDFGAARDGTLYCANCGKIHWKDLEGLKEGKEEK